MDNKSIALTPEIDDLQPPIPEIDALQNDNASGENIYIDKHAKFQENSTALIRKAVIAINNIGKVSNKKNFEYSEEEVETMFGAIEEAVADAKHLFKTKKEFHW